MGEFYNPVTKKRVAFASARDASFETGKFTREESKCGSYTGVLITNISSRVIALVVCVCLLIVLVLCGPRWRREVSVVNDDLAVEVDRSVSAMERYKGAFSTRFCKGTRC